MVKRLIFTVDEVRDRDILAWWDRQENKSAAVRALIRKELKQGGITLGGIYQVVREIDRKLARGAVVVGSVVEAIDADEPPDVAAALDSLGL